MIAELNLITYDPRTIRAVTLEPHAISRFLVMLAGPEFLRRQGRSLRTGVTIVSGLKTRSGT
jgi:hypothetical protein